MNTFNTLKSLADAAAPSGYIRTVSDLAAQLLSPLVDFAYQDRLNGVLGFRRCGQEHPLTVLLQAHLDEIGFMVTGHENGFLRFCALGGVDSRMLPGRELQMMTHPEGFGVIATKPPHVLTPEEEEGAPEIKDLYIDVGMDQEKAKQIYPVGTTAVYRETCTRLQGERVSGKALDNRACFTVILRTLELLKSRRLPYDLWVLGSDMEETGGNGAVAGTYHIHPDCAVILDVTFATQQDVSRRKGFELGNGPAIGMGPNMADWMTEKMKTSARALSFPINLEIMSGNTGTDGEVIQISREGVATQVLSVPIRYMHSPVEEVDLGDIERTAQLLAYFLTQLGGDDTAICSKY